MTPAQELRAIRLALGLTQEAMAEALCFRGGKGSVYDLESGRKSPDPRTMRDAQRLLTAAHPASPPLHESALQAELDEARDVLREVEWAGRDVYRDSMDTYDTVICPSCRAEQSPEGMHAPGCRLHAAITPPSSAAFRTRPPP